jgi:glyoxylase-like metal-dependent hydrolase (beta-lactamase superfamily II)
MDSAEGTQKNIESPGFTMTDIKAILVNHNHADQAGGSAYMKSKTGAPLMAGFGEIPYIEHEMFNPPAMPAPANGGGTRTRTSRSAEVSLRPTWIGRCSTATSSKSAPSASQRI